jgi:hypothetical protein
MTDGNMDGNKAQQVDQPLSNTISRHIPAIAHDYVVPERRKFFRRHFDPTKFIACRLPRRPFECLDEIREVRFKRLRMIVGDESDALLLALAQGRDRATFHGCDYWEAGPDLGVTVKQAIVQSVTVSIIRGISVAVLLEHEFCDLLSDIDRD